VRPVGEGAFGAKVARPGDFIELAETGLELAVNLLLEHKYLQGE